MKQKANIKILPLAVSVIIPQAAGALSALLSSNQSKIYQSLNLPFFAPPSWLFAPVWIVLYTLMGIASYLVYTSHANKNLINEAFYYYALQLVLNFFWSIIFFSLGLMTLAFIEILILLFFIILTTVYFFRINKTAGYFMIPYIVWVSFASLLNLSIILLN